MAEVANEGSERRIFKNKWFRRWARACRISDEQLCEAIDEANRGIVDADLGGGVIKQSIARPGQAKSKGFRSIVLFQLDKHSFFVFGFAKKDQANIPPEEERAYKELAKKLLFLTEGQIKTSLEEGELFEVKCNEENLQE